MPHKKFTPKRPSEKSLLSRTDDLATPEEKDDAQEALPKKIFGVEGMGVTSAALFSWVALANIKSIATASGLGFHLFAWSGVIIGFATALICLGFAIKCLIEFIQMHRDKKRNKHTTGEKAFTFLSFVALAAAAFCLTIFSLHMLAGGAFALNGLNMNISSVLSNPILTTALPITLIIGSISLLIPALFKNQKQNKNHLIILGTLTMASISLFFLGNMSLVSGLIAGIPLLLAAIVFLSNYYQTKGGRYRCPCGSSVELTATPPRQRFSTSASTAPGLADRKPLATEVSLPVPINSAMLPINTEAVLNPRSYQPQSQEQKTQMEFPQGDDGFQQYIQNQASYQPHRGIFPPVASYQELSDGTGIPDGTLAPSTTRI